MAPTICVPNRSARYAGTVAKPPPYIDRMMQNAATNRAMLPRWPMFGTSAYRATPRAKKAK
ncbi:hypothetical protein D9M71_621530 [compost metagenome]